jgi:NNP family nitrate/nitrite transporter-like MFS transporter
LPYTFAVPLFGGRNWTVVSALLLLLPCLALAWAVSNPDTSFTTMLLVAALAGLGGGNFASSMTNISWFFPEREKGWALGLNAAGGNVGVAVVQAPFVVSAVVTAGAGIHLDRAGLMWVPLVLLAAFAAWKYMDNLTVAKADLGSSAAAARRQHTWVMSFLYIGTFGSFIGYASAFPLLIKGQFPEVDVTTYAFLGALVGSLARPVGGRLSDRVGGARITAASYLAMGLGVLGVVFALEQHSFPAFLACFMVLFVATGVGNGSTYRMIPAIFRHGVDPGDAGAQTTARREAAAAIGIISAVGAYGGFLVPRTYGWAIGEYGSIVPALLLYVGLYAVMLAVTWAFYLRRSAPMARAGV